MRCIYDLLTMYHAALRLLGALNSSTMTRRSEWNLHLKVSVWISVVRVEVPAWGFLFGTATRTTLACQNGGNGDQ